MFVECCLIHMMNQSFVDLAVPRIGHETNDPLIIIKMTPMIPLPYDTPAITAI